MTVTTDQQRLRAQLEADILAGGLSLPVMPDIAARVNAAASNPSSTAASLARIIELDPALAARLMKMANSALYAGLSEIRDLDHAIGRIGTAMVVALVLGAAGREMFNCPDPDLRQLLDRAWIRSVHAAALARRLSARAGMCPEEGFLAGLLHAVGEPILLQRVAELLWNGSIERPDRGEIEETLAALGPRAGARLLAEWGLPETVVAAVEHGADPSQAPGRLRDGVWLVSVSAAIGRAIAGGKARDGAVQRELVARFEHSPLAIDHDALRGWIAVAIGDGAELSRVF